MQVEPVNLRGNVQLSVTFVEVICKGAAPRPTTISTATGLLFEHSDRVYLITNRHVVVDEAEAFYPDSLGLTIHTDLEDMTKRRSLTVPLYSNDEPLWVEHRRKERIDLVAVEIGSYLANGDVVALWNEGSIISMAEFVELGSTVNILGYPMAFFDELHHLPIAKTGTIATAYQVPFRGEPIFLIDANLQPGMSGGPVFISRDLRNRDGAIEMVWPGGYFLLLGVYSGNYSLNGVDLGLGRVWSAGLIKEILSD